MLANISVHEPKPLDDPDSALAFSMESGPGAPPSALLPFFWSPGWNSVQSVNKFQSEIGGPLRDGDPGIRLIEPSSNSGWQYFSIVPDAFKSRPGEWLLIPVFHIFGSEELSRQAHGISQLVPRSYLALNPADASLVRAGSGEQLRVVINDSQFDVEVALREDLPRGLAGIPSGVPPFESVQLPTFCKLLPVESEMSARGAR